MRNISLVETRKKMRNTSLVEAEKIQPITIDMEMTDGVVQKQQQPEKKARISTGQQTCKQNANKQSSVKKAIDDFLVMNFSKPLAHLCGLKFHEDLRTFLIVGIFFGLQFVNYNYNVGETVARTLFQTTSEQSYLCFVLRVVINVILLLLQSVFGFFCQTIVHNCIHFGQFRSKHMNTQWQIVLTHTYGHPVTSLIPGHNLGHHKHTQEQMDPMRTTQMHYKHNLMNLVMFFPTIVRNIIQADNKYFQTLWEREQEKRKEENKNGQPKSLSQKIQGIVSGHGSLQLFRLFLENQCFYPVQVFFLLKDWKLYAWCFLIPQMMAKIMIITINLLQHDGCPEPRGNEEPEELKEDEQRLGLTKESEEDDELRLSNEHHDHDHELRERKSKESESDKHKDKVHNTNLCQSQYYDPKIKRWFKQEYNQARDFTGNVINFWTCNNGFHTMHHYRPSMHWTKYPTNSARLIAPHQHPNLNQPNILKYLWRAFFCNDRRDFMGRSYFPDRDVPYEDWVVDFFKRGNVKDLNRVE